MKKNIFYTLAFAVLFAQGVLAQVPVMNPITGPTDYCYNIANGFPLYYASASNSPTSYSWSVLPAGAATIINSIPQIASIAFANLNGTYTVYCTATNGSGTSPSASFVVNVYEKPNVTFSGNTTICQGSSTNLSASPTIISASSTLNQGSSTLFYSWSPGTGLNTTSGPNVTANPQSTTNYTVSVLNGVCTSTAPLTIIVHTLPLVTAVSDRNPICQGESVTLQASGASYFQWSTGASGDSISVSPANDSTYTLIGTDVYSCSAGATVKVVVDICTSIAQRRLDLNAVRVYPNPSGGMVIIDLGTQSGKELSIRITDAMGKVVMSEKINLSNSSYDISRLNPGIYFVTLQQGQELKTLRLIKE